MSSIDASTSAIGGLIQLYKYEPFANSFTLNSNKVAGGTLSFARSSVELYQFLTNPTNVDVSFSSANGPNTSYSYTLGLVVDEVSGSTIYNTVSNSVTISPGRFVSPPSGTSFLFYKNEPLSNTFSSGPSFVGSIRINPPVTIPSLPIGISWQATVDLSTYQLVGTPTLQSSSSNYNIIGTDVCGGRTISTRANFAVGAERMLVDASGSFVVSALSIGTPIDTRGVIVRVPPYNGAGGKVRYTWTPNLPPGFSFQDAYGFPFSNGGIAMDPSSSIYLVGTPTSNTIQFFSNTSYSVKVTPTRITSPFLTTDVSFTFSADEVVLFDTPNIDSTFYTNAKISANAFSNSFKARTQFGTSPIVNIFSPDLRTDLSLIFVSGLQRADLSGAPTSSGAQTFTVQAVNANGKTADISASLAVINDAVQFTRVPSDVCATYITGRNVSNAKTGYYSAPAIFEASALSRKPISMTANTLFGTGLSFTSLGNNQYQITGTPANTAPLQTLTVTATASETAATATRSMLYSIIADQYDFADVSSSLQFVQNFAITPVQFSATTLSGLPVLYYFSTDIPGGLSLSTSGRLTGTLIGDTSGSFTVIASAGFTSGSETFPYTVRPDSMILFTPSNSYTVLAGGNVPDIQITGVTYSGLGVSNYQFSNLSPQYGLTLSSTTGILDGVLTNSIPPNDILPKSSNFSVTATAGALNGTLPTSLTTTNPVVSRAYLGRNKRPDTGIESLALLSSDNGFSNWTSNDTAYVFNGSNTNDVPGFQISDLQRKVVGFDSNTTMGTMMTFNSNLPAKLLRATSNGAQFSVVDVDVCGITNISSLTYKSGTSTWWGVGADKFRLAVFVRSDDEGATWTSGGSVQRADTQRVFCRDGWRPLTPTTINYYTTAGSAIRYKDGVLVVGGSGYSNTDGFALLRSTDEGSTWAGVTGSVGAAAEIATINTDAPSRWIVGGSLQYLTDDPASTFQSTGYTGTTTLFYSDNSGANWSNTTNDFNIAAYDVAYGNSTWLASGVFGDTGTGLIAPQLKYSTDGQTWSDVTQINDLFSGISGKIVPPIGIGPLLFDGTNWTVLVSTPSAPGYATSLYTHPANTDLGSNWTETFAAALGLSNTVGDRPPYVGLLAPVQTRTGSPISSTLTFNASAGAGPTITNPLQTDLVFYQYVPITPIVFSATGTGTIYFFVSTSSLPLGLSWNPLTQTISGAPVRTGNANFTVYAKDDNGITTIQFTTTTIVPRVIRKQDGAGAYTSLLRQYTVVNAAQNAVNNRVYPTQERTLGEFMAPYPSNVTTQSNCECK